MTAHSASVAQISVHIPPAGLTSPSSVPPAAKHRRPPSQGSDASQPRPNGPNFGACPVTPATPAMPSASGLPPIPPEALLTPPVCSDFVLAPPRCFCGTLSVPSEPEHAVCRRSHITPKQQARSMRCSYHILRRIEIVHVSFDSRVLSNLE